MLPSVFYSNGSQGFCSQRSICSLNFTEMHPVDLCCVEGEDGWIDIKSKPHQWGKWSWPKINIDFVFSTLKSNELSTLLQSNLALNTYPQPKWWFWWNFNIESVSPWYQGSLPQDVKSTSCKYIISYVLYST